MPTLNRTRLRSLLLWMLVGLVLCVGIFDGANGQAVIATAAEFGVRHAIIATLDLDRGAAASRANVGELKATMRISVRILDYASDSRFYGVVDGNFSDFDPSKGPARQEIWADHKCHQNRGLPTIWVVAINGRIAQGETISDISARPRHIGQRVPSDEIVIQKDLNMDVSDPTRSLVIRAKTKRSPLSFAVILKSTKCRLKED